LAEAHVIELPWPPSKLSRNGSQGDYRGKADAACKYRSDCYYSAKSALQGYAVSDGPIMLDMTYCAPDERKRDLDNLLAMTKQGIDAIAQILGVDDYRFEYTVRRGAKAKGGKIIVRIG
jgi:crossover junction endodeoxyribonuclease RusA